MQSAAAGPDVRTVEAEISYVAPGSRINRRFVAPGVECNTGRYETYRVPIRDGRAINDRFSLDVHGFLLAERPTAVTDFLDRDQVERIYPAEVEETVKALTGATRVVLRGWMIRTSGDLARYHAHHTVGYTHQAGVQPPAGEAHVDFLPDCAERMAREIYAQAFPRGRGYSRFIASSLWRAFSDPPQDWPLALCDARSVGVEEGVPNTLHVVDRIPDEAEMLREMPGEDSLIAAAIFPYNPRHRWWYFSNMTRDEVVLIKFHDSDRRRALRTPHTAFRDTSFPDARPRHSIEYRSFAFFE
jgi:hypothetical protein